MSKRQIDHREGETKLLLIGCGAVSEVLYRPAFQHIKRTGNGKLVAVMDTNLQRAKEYAAGFGANAYDNLDAALTNENLDAAVVATPHTLHAPITIQCLKSGLGVLCEKPLAITSDECQVMIDTATQVQKPLMVGLFRRYFPSTRAIKLLIDEEALGPVTSFEFLEGEKYDWPAKTTSFFSKNAAGGGVLIDAGVHLIDLLLWWLGDVSHAEYSDDSMGGVEANCELKLTMDSGVTGRVRMSREHPFNNQYIIRCEKGDLIYKCDVANSVFVRDHHTGRVKEYDLQKAQTIGGVLFPSGSGNLKFSFLECFCTQLDDFCMRVGDSKDVICNLDHAKKGIQLIEACYKNKKFMAMPWLSDEEYLRALQLSQSTIKTEIATKDHPDSRMKIGVVGAGGFIGYRLCEWLILNDRAEVTPIIHSAKNFALLGRFDIKAEFADLLDLPSLEESFKGKDVIIHAAVGDDETIVQGIANTLKAAKNAGVKRIVYLSTACVYGNAPAAGTDEESPFMKDQKFSYNNSKIRAEGVINELKEELSLDVIILRPFLVWGPRSQYWVIDLGEAIRSGKAFLIEDGQGVCNSTYVDNLIEAIWLSVITENCKNSDFIITDNEQVSWKDFYYSLARIYGVDLRVTNISCHELMKVVSNQRLRRRNLLKATLFRIGARVLPQEIKSRIVNASPILAALPESYIDEELSSLQLARYTLSCEKAREFLGYTGHVSFAEGMQLTGSWLRFARGEQ